MVRADNELDTCWRRAAASTDGRLSSAGHGGKRLVTYMDQRLVRAEIKPLGDGWMTTVTSDAAGETDLRLAVSFDPDFPYADSFPIAVADELDARFTTQTNDAPYARLWLGDNVRSAIQHTEHYHFVLYDGVARAWRFGAERDAGALVAAMNAVVAVGGGGAAIREAWQRLATHLGGHDVPAAETPAGCMAMVVKPSCGNAVAVEGFYGRIGRRRNGRGVVTRLRCPRTTSLDDQYVIEDTWAADGFAPEIAGATELDLIAERYRVRCSSPEQMRRTLAGLQEALVALEPSAVVVNPELATVLLPELVTDAPRLIAAIEVLRDLAGETAELRSGGPYR